VLDYQDFQLSDTGLEQFCCTCWDSISLSWKVASLWYPSLFHPGFLQFLYFSEVLYGYFCFICWPEYGLGIHATWRRFMEQFKKVQIKYSLHSSTTNWSQSGYSK
jgi:hypothetical protein